MPRLLLLAVIAAAALVAAGCGSADPSSTAATTATPSDAASAPPATTKAPKADPALSRKPKVERPSRPAPKRLVVKDLIKGSGPTAKTGDGLDVDYVGVLYKNGKQFDASWDRGQPFSFQLGAGQVIPGWDQGLIGMKAGGRRELIIPPAMAYGTEGSPPAIPPSAPLIFVVDLKQITG